MVIALLLRRWRDGLRCLRSRVSCRRNPSLSSYGPMLLWECSERRYLFITGGEDSPAKDALIAFGKLYYWIHRTDLEVDEIDRACVPALDVLVRPDQFGAAPALHMLTRSMLHEDGVRESVIRWFPGTMANVCRNALRQADDQIGYFPYFPHDKHEVLQSSVDLIGSLGDIGDLPLLRAISEHADIGPSAIKAIQRIEGQSGVGG